MAGKSLNAPAPLANTFRVKTGSQRAVLHEFGHALQVVLGFGALIESAFEKQPRGAA